MQFSFEPADIINEVMSFGSSTPVEVAVSGPDFAQTRPYAAKVKAEMAKISGLRDLQVVQSLDYPTVQVDVDRKKAGTVYVTPVDVSRSLAEATSSSRFTVPNFWADPKTRHRLPGAGGGPAAGRAPPRGIKPLGSIADLEMVPVKHNAAGQVLVRDVATVSTGNHARRNRPLQHATPGEHDGERRRHGPRQHFTGKSPRPWSAQASLRPAPRSKPAGRFLRCATCSAGWPSGWGWPWS